MVLYDVKLDRQRLAEICRRYHVQRLSLFGSILRRDFSSGSDVDMLVEFEPGARLGLRYFALEQELSELVGRQVDLNTAAFLSPEYRDQVISTAVVQYDAAA